MKFIKKTEQSKFPKQKKKITFQRNDNERPNNGTHSPQSVLKSNRTRFTLRGKGTKVGNEREEMKNESLGLRGEKEEKRD